VFAHRGRDQLTWNELMNSSLPPPELGASLSMIKTAYHVISARLRDARRPEPPSLKEQAFDALHGIHDQGPTPEQVAIIRRALEALDG
jgi:hypothetical protein